MKDLAQGEIKTEWGFDPFDKGLTGVTSGDLSLANQWANNLISNKVLEQYMVVVRTRPVVLYPLSIVDNSVPDEKPAERPEDIDQDLANAADARQPSTSTAKTVRFQRAPALAEFVRKAAGYRCIVDSPSCVVFEGLDGNPYVEVHHIIPMSMQGRTTFNLDRSANMVAICVACHTRLHHAVHAEAEGVLHALLANYETTRGQAFADSLSECDLPHAHSDLLNYLS